MNRLTVKLIVTAAVVVGVTACASAPARLADTTTAAPTTTVDASRCLPVPASVVGDINTTLTKGSGRVTLRFAQAVLVTDFPGRYYFIAGDLEGPGLDRTDDVAVWARLGSIDQGFMASVDYVTREFSTIQPGPAGRFPDQTSEGYQVVRGCVARMAANSR